MFVRPKVLQELVLFLGHGRPTPWSVSKTQASVRICGKMRSACTVEIHGGHSGTQPLSW